MGSLWREVQGGCGLRAPPAVLLVAEHKLAGIRALECGSVVVVLGLSCPAACGIFPDQGLNPCPLYWQAEPETLDHRGVPKGLSDWAFG